MLILDKSLPINQLIVSVWGQKVTTSSLYLFQFEHDLTKVSNYLLVNDSSFTPDSYSQFIVTGSITGSLQAGLQSYTCYESPSGSMSTIGLNRVANGRMLVKEIKTTTPFYSASIQSYVSYEPTN